MSICIPKHIYCNWFKPNFTPSQTPCTLISAAENRSRLGIGGTLFRSKEFGEQQNNISVQAKWMVPDGSGGLRYYDPLIDSRVDVEQVELTVTNGYITEIYYADQKGNPSPPWISNAIPQLRSDLSNNSS